MRENVIILDKEKVEKYFSVMNAILVEEKCYVEEQDMKNQLKEIERFLKLTKLEQNN